MTPLPERQVQIRDALIEALRSDLIGPMLDDEVLSAAPSRWYLTGFLVPVGAPEEQRVDALADEATGGEVEGDADDTDDDVRAARSFLPSSIGLTVFVPTSVEALDVEASWGDYEQLSEADTRAWLGTERERAGQPIPDDEEALRYRYWRRIGTTVVPLRVPLDRQQVPVGADGIYLRVVRRVIGADRQAVSLFLVNGRAPLGRHAPEADERSLFQAQLRVQCPSLLPRTRAGALTSDDDRRDDLQYRDHAEWAVGHGVATQAQPGEYGRCEQVATSWLPEASVYRMKAAAIDGVLTGMEDLAAADPDALGAGLLPLFDAYAAWIEDRRGALSSLGDARREAGEALLTQATEALERMRAGVQLLHDDPLALQAFRVANRAMGASARRERDGAPRWRLFQLGFLLLNLVGLTDPQHADRRRVELLFFPTGGGKTEAYLGVAAYSLALRRIRHRREPGGGAGVAVLLRYTLRLLTLDQLRRAAQLVCALELERRASPHLLGEHRFSIGLWVGKSATPNHLKDAARSVRKAKEGRFSGGEAAATPLKSCPWCKTPLTPESVELFPDRKRPVAMLVGCPDPGCPFSFRAHPDLPEHQDGLPVVSVDEHLYRELPSIVVGTVDKFASLPWRGELGMLFGRVAGADAHGFRGVHEARLGPDVQPLRDGLRPPELILQDELHLISGPLGTMVGLYETAIEALCLERDGDGHSPKIIASTATARRATEQIQALFARDQTRLFPPQGIDAGDTFFATEDRSPAATRRYVGVAAPGRSAKVLAARAYTTLLGAAQRHWEDAAPGLDNPADTYMTLVAYFNALKELGGAQRLVQEDIATRTEQLADRRPVNQAESPHLRPRQLSYDLLELTSRQSTDTISSAIERLKRPVGGAFRDKMDVLLASSMISVGVDIERLGLMVVNGQPKTTAEYIQASSRVGRKTPGLVVTSLNLFKPRDRSHYERFQAYHQSFYREVEATSVTPFSTRAVERGLAGLIVGLTRHLDRQMTPNRNVERIGRATATEARVTELLLMRLRAHRDAVDPALADRLRDHIEARFKNWRWVVERAHEDALPLRFSPWEDPKKLTALLSSAVDDLTGDLAEGLEHFRAPTSMRDVEPSVHIWVDFPRKEGHR